MPSHFPNRAAHVWALVAFFSLFGMLRADAAQVAPIRLMPLSQNEQHGIITRKFLVVRTASNHQDHVELLILPRVSLAELCDDRPVARKCQKTGILIPFARRPAPYADPVFELPTQDNVSSRYILTVWSRSDMPFAFAIQRRDAYLNRLLLARTIDAAFLGALVAVLFFSIVALAEMRTVSSLYFIGYLCSLGFVELVATGIGMQYIWPEFAFDRALLVLIATELGFVLYCFFARSFVALSTKFPRLDRIVLAALALQVILASIEYAYPSSIFRGFVVASEFCTLGALAVVAILLVGNAGVSRLYAISFFPAMLGAAASVWYEAFGLGRGSIFAWKGIEFGTSLQCLAISVSVFGRLRVLREERQQIAQTLAITELENVELGRIATTDALTGVPNRVSFFDELRTALAQGRVLALLYLDLDRFKPVNDQFGHATGDHVLQIVAERLRRAVRNGDLVARLGGDEFAVALLGEAPAEVSAIIASIRLAVEHPMRIDTHSLSVGVSIGVARGPDFENADALVDAADHGMYEDKKHRGAKGNS